VNDSFPTRSYIATDYSTNPYILKLRVKTYGSSNLNNTTVAEMETLLNDVNGNAVNYVHLFDESSGIPIPQITHLINLLDNHDLTSKLSTFILDFDRTFTMIEGVARLPNMVKFATGLQNPNCTPEKLVEFYMGGKARLAVMKLLLDKLVKKNIKLIILTNNPSADIINDFIQNYVYNYNDGNALALYEIITTYKYNYRFLPLNSNLSPKLNIIFEKNLCDEKCIKDAQIFANYLETNGFNVKNLFTINSLVIAKQAIEQQQADPSSLSVLQKNNKNLTMSGGYRYKKKRITKKNL